MSDMYQCGDNAALVGYVYDECEAAERAAIGAHVAVCGACAAELAALESTRLQLQAWAPPDAALGFVITRRDTLETPAPSSASVLRPRRWWFARPLPVWAQMAAAVTLFAAGLSLGVARGLAPAPPGQARMATPAAPSPQSVSPDQLAALEQRLRAEISQVRQAPAVSAPAGDGQLLARVRALIGESEQRQQQELALRIAEMVRDFDSQRRLDLAQIQRNFGQIEGVTGAEVLQQRQMLDYLIRVSQQPR